MLETFPQPAETSGGKAPRSAEATSGQDPDQIIGYIRERNPGDTVGLFPGAEKGSSEEKANRIFDGLVYTLTEVAEECYEKRSSGADYRRVLQAMAPLTDFALLFAEGKLNFREDVKYEKKRLSTGDQINAYEARFISAGERYVGNVTIRPQLVGSVMDRRDQRVRFDIYPEKTGDLGAFGVRIDPESTVTYDLQVNSGGVDINLVDRLNLESAGQSYSHHFRSSEKLPGRREQFREILDLFNKKAKEQLRSSSAAG